MYISIAYIVITDPVLIYTIMFSCARLPGRKIKCVYENWITYDHGSLSPLIQFSYTQLYFHVHDLGRASVPVTIFS